jgi:hypothetical protein
MRSCLGLLDEFLQRIKDIREGTADNFRRFFAHLYVRPMWPGSKYQRNSLLSGTTITIYGHTTKTFFRWL